MNFREWITQYTIIESLVAESDEELIDRASKGDSVAISELISRWQPKIQSLARRFSKGRTSPDDVAQDAAIKVFKALERGAKPEKPPNWLYTIVKNVAKDYNKRHLSLNIGFDSIDKPGREKTPLDNMLSKEKHDTIRKSVDELDPIHQDIIKSRYYQDEPELEAGKRLGIPAGTVKSRVHKAKNKLEKILRRKGIEE